MNVFAYCAQLESIKFPDYLESFGKNCFCQCLSLKSLTIQTSLKILPDYCFAYSHLEIINFSGIIECFGNNCFYKCESLKSITLPSSLTSIGNECFAGCAQLEEFSFPEEIKSIGSSCFANCISLTTIFLDSSMVRYGKNCFIGCTVLQNIHFSERIDLRPFKGTPAHILLRYENIIEAMKGNSPYFEPYCPVCREEFNEYLKPFIIKKCKHVFCVNCLDEMVVRSDKCALCNQPIE